MSLNKPEIFADPMQALAGAMTRLTLRLAILRGPSSELVPACEFFGAGTGLEVLSCPYKPGRLKFMVYDFISHQLTLHPQRLKIWSKFSGMYEARDLAP